MIRAYPALAPLALAAAFCLACTEAAEPPAGGGEELLGWHVNRGPDEAADWFPASRFRDRLHRPDVVGRDAPRWLQHAPRREGPAPSWRALVGMPPAGAGRRLVVSLAAVPLLAHPGPSHRTVSWIPSFMRKESRGHTTSLSSRG